jgi:hypothetical protein
MIQPSLTNRIAIIECSLKHFDSHFDHSQTDREKGYYIISPIQHFFAKIFIFTSSVLRAGQSADFV